MHRLPIFLLLILISKVVFAQTGGINQLRHQLTAEKSDTGRVRIMLAISHAYNMMPDEKFRYGDSAIAYARKAEQLSIKHSCQKGVGFSYQEIARYMVRKHNFKQCKQYTDRAVELFKQSNLIREEAEAWLLEEEFYVASGGQDMQPRVDYYKKARSLFHTAGAIEREAATLKILGDFLQVQQKYPEALAMLKESLALYQKTKYRELQGLYDLISYVSSLLGDYENGVKYGLAALRTAEAMRDTSPQLCTIYNRLGLTYSRLTQYPQSEAYYAKAVKVALKFKDTATIVQVMLNDADALRRIHKYTEALRMLKFCIAKYPKSDREYQLLALTTMVTLYLDMKQVNMAGTICDKMLSILGRPPAVDKNTEMAVRLSAVKYFTMVRQFEKAREYLRIYAERNSQLHIAIGILTSYKYKYIIDSTQHRYFDALNDYRQYTILKDSVFNLKKSKQIEELRISYETEKKENDIKLLKKDGTLEREKTMHATNIRNLTLMGSALLIILLGVIYANYRAKQRTNIALNALVSEKDELIKEKEWLIKEVHHRVKNNLQIVMGLLQRQSAYIDNEAALHAIQNSESRMHSIALIHQKLYQSENLDLINMPEYVTELLTYLKESTDTGSRISFEKTIEDIYLAVSQAVPLGLIMNEAITNSIKYAYADDECGSIRITLKQLNHENVVLTVKDHGRGLQSGFDINKVNSLGMSLMKGLSKQLSGTFELNNNNGVQIQVTFKTECFIRPPHELTNTKLGHNGKEKNADC